MVKPPGVTAISSVSKPSKTYKQRLSDVNMDMMKTKRYANNSNRKVKWAVGT